MYFIYVSSDPGMISSMEQAMKKADTNRAVVSIANGYDLVQFLQNVKKGESYPDFIILSIKMPRINGRELLELLKTDDIYRLIPVVMLVQVQNDEDEFFCQRLGADTMISPVLQNDWEVISRRICASVA